MTTKDRMSVGQVGTTIIAIDVSGSVDSERVEGYLSLAEKLARGLGAHEAVYILFDSDIVISQVAALGKCTFPERIPMGGGTDPQCVFDYIERALAAPANLFVVSDLEFAKYPERTNPKMNVFWVDTQPSTRKGEPPFGARLSLKIREVS